MLLVTLFKQPIHSDVFFLLALSTAARCGGGGAGGGHDQRGGSDRPATAGLGEVPEQDMAGVRTARDDCSSYRTAGEPHVGVRLSVRPGSSLQHHGAPPPRHGPTAQGHLPLLVHD